jgi:hypothetical protein
MHPFPAPTIDAGHINAVAGIRFVHFVGPAAGIARVNRF